MMRLRAARRGEGGQALVEFALVSLVFFLLVFGMIDVGRAAWNYNTLAQATREGTRYAIVHGADSSNPSGPDNSGTGNSNEEITPVVEKFAAGLDISQLTIQSEWIDGDNQAGSRVKVTSSYAYQPMFDFFGITSFNMSSSSTMVITN